MHVFCMHELLVPDGYHGGRYLCIVTKCISTHGSVVVGIIQESNTFLCRVWSMGHYRCMLSVLSNIKSGANDGEWSSNISLTSVAHNTKPDILNGS
jgi:hypothetical protein